MNWNYQQYSRTRFQKKTKQWEKKKPQKQIRDFGKKELSLFLKICFPQQKIHELRFKKNRNCKNNLPWQKRTLDKNFPWTFTWKMMSCVSKRMDDIYFYSINATKNQWNESFWQQFWHTMRIFPSVVNIFIEITLEEMKFIG